MMKKTLCALAVLATTSLPVLAEDVNVKGTIKAAACKIDLPAAKDFNYGEIPPTDLVANGYFMLPEKEIDITLSCNAPAKMGLMAVNGRAGTLAGAVEGVSTAGEAPVNIFGASKQAVVGLGMDGTDKIGGYGVRLNQGKVVADGKPVDVIVKGAASTTWVKSASGVMYNSAEMQHLSWAKTGEKTPVAFTNMTGKLTVQAYINKKSELDLGKVILLDGSTVLEMVYL